MKTSINGTPKSEMLRHLQFPYFKLFSLLIPSGPTSLMFSKVRICCYYLNSKNIFSKNVEVHNSIEFVNGLNKIKAEGLSILATVRLRRHLISHVATSHFIHKSYTGKQVIQMAVSTMTSATFSKKRRNT